MSQMEQVIQMFIDAGRLPAALSEAARWGEIQLVRQLLEQGVPVDIQDESGGTALMNAASGGQVKIVTLLLERGADVNAMDVEKGYTPLIWCVAGLHKAKVYLAVVKALLAAGADATVAGHDGKTALDFARTRGSEELVRLLETAAR